MAALNHGEPSNKENKTMARKKKRTYGTGGVSTLKNGSKAVRWREKVIQPDGTVKIIHRSKAAGKISLREANELLRGWLAATKTPTAAPMTFEEFAAKWEVLIVPQYPKHSTRKHHVDIAKNKLIPYFGKKVLSDIGGEDVQQFVAAMEKRGYAAHSIHHYHTVLRSMLSTAKKWKHIDDNPAFGAKLPKLIPKNEQWVFEYDQAQSLLERLPLRVRLAVHLAFLMRRGEVFAARWRNFDETAATIEVEQAIYDHVIDTPKTENSIRTIPLPGVTVALLKQWRAKSKWTKPDDFILAGRDGVPGDHARMLNDYIKPACGALGFKRACWLTFRRSWNTWADGLGVSPKMRGAIVGNSDAINSRIYTKTIPSTLRNAVEMVGNKLCANCAPQSEMVN